MNIVEFVKKSLGQWRSQRSAHHLAFAHYEEIISTIDIEPIDLEDSKAIELCKSYDIDPKLAISPFKMSWSGESDWDDNEVQEGSSILIPIPQSGDLTKGRLLREKGYAETIPAVGEYHISEDGTFILVTKYDRAAAEEKIWFATPNVRCRVSLIKTNDGQGVTTASYSSEIRSLKNSPSS